MLSIKWRLATDTTSKEILQTAPKTYQDNAVSWGNVAAENASKSTVLNEGSVDYQQSSALSPEVTEEPLINAPSSNSDNIPKAFSNLFDTYREIAKTATASVFEETTKITDFINNIEKFGELTPVMSHSLLARFRVQIRSGPLLHQHGHDG